MSGSVAFEVRGLSCRLGGVQILDGVELDICYGSVLALVGPNGAGKSTLLGALCGDVPATSGEVRLDGQVLGDWEPRMLARRRSMLLQANQVSFPFTVREVVEMGRSPWIGSSSAEEDETAVEEALRLTDTAGLAERTFPVLSGGEKARVSLARVLAQHTDVVLLDEPTAALDLRHQEDVMTIARDLARRGKAVVVVLHDLSLAASYADDVVILDRGRVVAHGPAADVITPEAIERTYGIAVHVLSDPDGRLVVVPRRPHADTVSA